MNKLKLAIHCNENRAFIPDIINGMSKGFTVRVGDNKKIQETFELMKWSDVSFFEWCDKTAIGISTLPKVCKNIIRLHGYEAFTGMLDAVQWDYIDRLIVVSPVMLPVVKGRTGKVKPTVIFNGLNMKNWKYEKKEKGFNIIRIGYINEKKNLPFIIQIMHDIVKVDNRYMLHLVGESQNTLISRYVKHLTRLLKLEDNIIEHGFLKQEKLNALMGNMNYLLSGSIQESFGYSIAEGMACGLKPVVHWFEDAELIWPEKCLFKSQSEAVEMITNDEFNSVEYRKFIKDNYSLERQLGEIRQLIKEVAK